MKPGVSKNYISIGVSVRTTKFAARNPDNYWEHQGSTGKQPAIPNYIYFRTLATI